MGLYTAPEYNFNRDEYRMQIAIGSTLYPANTIRPCADSQLDKAVGGLQEAVGLSVGANYRSTCHIAAVDLEKAAGGKATFTGISTKNSGEIHVVYEDVTAHTDMATEIVANKFNYYPSQTYVCLCYDTTLVLERSGVLFAD